ncbi:topoisomerase DNA-binding C4 zinc finger domain-containing protein [Methanolobus zinderi]|uniref:DNA topoisomerase n=1 Tax=Methanolobus zinderi TaxID=536044 RepID=A0A7D5EG44_9EURY|nr:DNA topoisomerase [Methanolobus zinderi]QLC49620.1 topoisomerase DNA-binding C4 zinc finger domain-containing protein [Methanolobus zinderi]
MSIVVFTEKNKAAAQIAGILSEGGFNRASIDGIPVYDFKKNGKEWRIMGLSGHIMGYDFPPEYSNWRECDPAVLLDTDPVKNVLKKPYATAISRLAGQADELILACDFDREGENIGFEAKSIAEKSSRAPVKRARFSSLSASEIKKAFGNLVEPNENLAMSAEARQILDLKMGAAFTRFMTLSVREHARTKGIISIGPCQTPTCGFVYERERLIRDFKAKDFWKIEGIFSHSAKDFKGTHRAGNITEKAKADEIFKRIKDCKKGTVAKKREKESAVNPPYPLNTTEFLKRASKYLGISPETALEVAEQLYLAGFTSYPRTETNKYADDFDFKTILVGFSSGEFREQVMDILSRSQIKSRNGTKDGHDHPPIYPIRAAGRQEIEKSVRMPDAWKVYDLIVRHFIANLMPPAIFDKTRLEVHVRGEIFDATGSILKDAGWLAVYPFENKNDKLLPNLELNDEVDVKKLSNTRSKTSPPKRLTEAELLTLMDKNGIGTKATAPSHIETNKKRGYFETKGKTIAILDTGFTLMESLDSSVPILVKPDIRARIEALIQDVEDGKKSFDSTLEEGSHLIREMYSQLRSGKEQIVTKLAGTITDESIAADKKNFVGECPECGRMLRIVRTDKGRFVGCSGYPSCKNTYPLPKKGALNVLRSKQCEKEGVAVIKVGNKYHWSVGMGPCFTCDSEKKCFPPEVIGTCPKCDGSMFIITTKDTRFLACTERCGYTQSLPKEGRLTVKGKCKHCDWKQIRVKPKEKDANEFCINLRCSSRKSNSG